MMLPLDWQTYEVFHNPATGEPLIRWAVSTSGYTTVEMSMCDERIKAELPQEDWMPVYLLTRNNLRTFARDGAAVLLYGFGSPNDPAGNLMFVRVRTDIRAFTADAASADAQHLKRVVGSITAMMRGMGISMDNDMYDLLRRN